MAPRKRTQRGKSVATISAADRKKFNKLKTLNIVNAEKVAMAIIEEVEEEFESHKAFILDLSRICCKQLETWQHVTVEEMFKCLKDGKDVQRQNVCTTKLALPIEHVSDMEVPGNYSATSEPIPHINTKNNIKKPSIHINDIEVSNSKNDDNSENLDPMEVVNPAFAGMAIGGEGSGGDSAIDDCSESDSASAPPRMSDITALIESTKQFETRGRKRKVPAVTATESKSRTKTRIGAEANTGMPAPPATTRPSRSKKAATGTLITPANPRRPPLGSFVTPKFDPRLPLPKGTVRRHAKPNDVPISLNGSPLRLSPDRRQIKGIFEKFIDTLADSGASLSDREREKMISAVDKYVKTNP